MLTIIGQDIGRYHITEELGEGGMAIVYKATDKRLEREVAIKFIRKDAIPEEQVEGILKRFEREAKSLGNFMHPNIVPIIDYGEYEDNPYLVMPYLPGGTLKDRSGTPMNYREVAKLLAPVARALEYAHNEGIIHRDIKPANILITRQGQPMLSDFGIAKILFVEGGETLTGTGVGIGTPKYMAPEQWQNQVSSQTDVYALGIVFYELITGHLPFDANTPAGIYAKQLTEQPLPISRFIPGVPSDVQQVLDKSLARDPNSRYMHMASFADDLEKLAQGYGLSATPIPVSTDHSATVDVVAGAIPLAGETVTMDSQAGSGDSRTVTMDEGMSASQKPRTPVPVKPIESSKETVRMETINPTPYPPAAPAPAAPKQKSGNARWIWLGIGGTALLFLLGIGLVLLFLFSQGWSISFGEASATPAARVIVVTATPSNAINNANGGQQQEVSQTTGQEKPTAEPTPVPSPEPSATTAPTVTAKPALTGKLALEENFENGLDQGKWQVRGAWKVVEEDGGNHALCSGKAGSQMSILSKEHSWKSYTLAYRMMIKTTSTNGVVGIGMRTSYSQEGTKSYQVQYSTRGISVKKFSNVNKTVGAQPWELPTNKWTNMTTTIAYSGGITCEKNMINRCRGGWCSSSGGGTTFNRDNKLMVSADDVNVADITDGSAEDACNQGISSVDVGGSEFNVGAGWDVCFDDIQIVENN